MAQGKRILVTGGAGFLLATGVNYVLSVRHVFAAEVRFSRRKELLAAYAVSAVSAVGLLWHQAALYAASRCSP